MHVKLRDKATLKSLYEKNPLSVFVQSRALSWFSSVQLDLVLQKATKTADQ